MSLFLVKFFYFHSIAYIVFRYRYRSIVKSIVSVNGSVTFVEIIRNYSTYRNISHTNISYYTVILSNSLAYSIILFGNFLCYIHVGNTVIEKESLRMKEDGVKSLNRNARASATQFKV